MFTCGVLFGSDGGDYFLLVIFVEMMNTSMSVAGTLLLSVWIFLPVSKYLFIFHSVKSVRRWAPSLGVMRV